MLPPVTHTRDPRLDISRARQVLKDALRTHDAREIVRWLDEHTHELTRSRFFELMFSFGPLAGTLLNAVSRLLPAAHPEAAHAPHAILLGDSRAERPQGCGSAEHILAGQQARDRSLAQGHGAEHQRAMRYRLVAGGAHLSRQPGNRPGDQFARGGDGQGRLRKQGKSAARRPPIMPEFGFDRVKDA